MPDTYELTALTAKLAAFELFWSYCHLTEGGLYSDRCAEAAAALGKALQDAEAEGLIRPETDYQKLPKNVDPKDILQCLARDRTGAPGDFDDLLQRTGDLNAFFPVLKSILHERLNLDVPALGPDGSELMYRASVSRWQGHFPTAFLLQMADADKIMAEASNSETIVVIGDIRRSQDLMTYSKDSETFAAYMVRFIQTTRNIIDENLGIFDKFTGDGFLAYFNEAVCKRLGGDFTDCFVEFVKSEMQFAEAHFHEWLKTVRRLPDKPSGLSLGGDIGRVAYRDMESHFITVGDPIVYAERMCSAAAAGETLVNNPLYRHIKDRPETSFAERTFTSKTGERLAGRLLLLNPKNV